MTLEFWRRRRLWIVTAPAAMTVLPSLVYGMLRSEGLSTIQDTQLGRSLYLAFFILCLIYMSPLILGFPRAIAQRYVLPISTRSLVGWNMINGMVAAALVYACSAIFMNLAFQAGWPLWGPAVVAAVTFAWGQAIVWSLRTSVALQLAAGSVLALGVGLWASEKYGPDRFDGVPGVTAGMSFFEAFTFVTLTVLAYWLATVGVARDRCGEGVNLDRLKRRVVALFGRLRWERSEAFHSAGSALLWLEWKRRGRAYPILAAIAATIAIVVCISPWVDAETGLGLVAGLSVVLMMLGPLAGMFMGHRSEDFTLGSFLATRPIADAKLANVVLKNTALSVVAAFGVWTAGASIVVGWFLITGQSRILAETWRGSHQTQFAGVISIPVLVVGGILASWTVTALAASLALSRKWLAISFLQVAVFASILFLFLHRFVVPERFQDIMASAALSNLVLACVLGTGWAFLSCHGRGFVSAKTIWSVLALWTLIVIAVTIAVRFPSSTLPPQGLISLIGLSTLPFAPVAVAPLALSWNRHR